MSDYTETKVNIRDIVNDVRSGRTPAPGRGRVVSRQTKSAPLRERGWVQWFDQKRVEAGLLSPKDYDAKYPLTMEEQLETPQLNTKRRSLGERFVDSANDAVDNSLIVGTVSRAIPAAEDYRATESNDPASLKKRVVDRIRERRQSKAARDTADPVFRDDESYLSPSTLARGAAYLGGSIAGDLMSDPTSYISPGKTALGRIAAQGAINAGMNAAKQGVDVYQGTRDEFDPGEVALAGGIGAATQGGFEGIAKGLRGVRKTPEEIVDELLAETPSAPQRAPESPVETLDERINPEPRSAQEEPRVEAAEPVQEAPAVEAAEPIPEPQPSRVGGINVENLGLDPVGEHNLRTTLDAVPLEDTSRSRDATQAKADELGLTNEDYVADNSFDELSSKIDAGRKLVRSTVDEVTAAAKEFGPGSPELTASIQKLLEIAPKHSKNASELGRGLNILGRPLANKHGEIDIDEAAAQQVAKIAADPEAAPRLVDLLEENADDPEVIKKIAEDMNKPSFRDKLFNMRYVFMLSGLKTHAYNIMGNALNLAVDVGEHGFASLIGKARSIATGDLDRVTGEEMAARVIGSVVGARRGIGTARLAYKLGKPLDDAARHDMVGHATPKWAVPLKAMAAEDEFFRATSYQSEFYGQAVRKAFQEGLKGEALRKRVQEILADPSADMISGAMDYAKRMRFQDDPSFLGKAIEYARSRQKSDSFGKKLGKDVVTLILPFVRTPESLLRTAIRRSPLGVMDSVNIADFKAGGARRDLAISRVALGSGVSAYIGLKAAEGLLTGEGPRDYKQRQEMELNGWQANSIKLGDKYYSYEGFEPLSMLLSGIATTMERWKEGSGKGFVDQAALQAVNAAEVLSNQTYTQGLNDVFKMLDAPEGQRAGNVNNFFANIAASFAVPAAVRQINQTYFDDKIRDTRGNDTLMDRVTGRIQSGIPGLSTKLPAQTDALGRELGRGDALGPDIVSRAYTPKEESTPVSKELVRLMGTDEKGTPPLVRLSRSVNSKDFDIGKLNARDYNNYQIVAGTYINALLKEAIESPEWLEMTDDERRKEIKSIAKDARGWAREDLFAPKEDK